MGAAREAHAQADLPAPIPPGGELPVFRQLAAAYFLPSINPGLNYDSHTGVLQQSNGNILSVDRSAVYVGAWPWPWRSCEWATLVILPDRG